MAEFWDVAAATEALKDPNTPAENLATFAQQFPELREAILRHPQVYPGLANWIVERRPAPGAADPVAPVVPAAQTSRSGGTGNRLVAYVRGLPRRTRVIVAASSAALLVLVIGVSAAAIAAGQQEPPPAAVVEHVEPAPEPEPEPGFGAVVEELVGAVVATGPHGVVTTTGSAASYAAYTSASPGSVTFGYTATGEEQVGSSDVAVQQATAAEPGFALLVSLVTPSQGLEGEKVRCVVRLVSADGTTAGSHDLAECYERVEYADDVVLLFRSEGEVDGNDVGSITALSAESGAVLWNASSGGHNVPQAAMTCGGGVAGARQGEMEVTDAGTVLFAGNGRLVAHDYHSGAQSWAKEMDRCYEGYFFPSGFDSVTLLAYNGTTWLDTRSGTEFAVGHRHGVLDPVNGLLAVTYEWAEGGNAYETIDATTGQIVFALSAAEAEAGVGHFGVTAAYDGRVWIWTADGPDIIDARTGAQDPAAPAGTDGIPFTRNIPTAAGSSWVLLGGTNGFGELGDPTTIVWSSDPVSFADLPRTIVGG